MTIPSVLKKTLASVVIVYVTLVVVMLLLTTGSAIAVEIDESIRTVPLNNNGMQTTLSLNQLALGRQKFNNSCAQCHLDGGSKTNPDVDLSTETLALATPPRNSIESIVNYLNEPTTYDGVTSLAAFHPSTLEPEIFPIMQSLSEDDLSAIAGYILTQPRIVGQQWAGGKPKR
ncbi:MAG: photosystem II cytochrome c-550 [Cyanobacteria bacterium P01_D01_bin.36]